MTDQKQREQNGDWYRQMGRMRSYINKKFIESNPSLVEAMVYFHKTRGRRKNILARACVSLQLYVKYVIFQWHLIDERQKMMNKALYPESRINQGVEIENIEDKLKSSDCVTFDMWGVLFYETLDRQQLLALAEVLEYCIGLSDVQDIRNALSEEQLNHIEEIAADFTLENPTMHDLLTKAVQQGKEVYIYNNSDHTDEFSQKILNICTCDIKLSKKINGLHITNNDMTGNTVQYKNVNMLGEVYRPFCYLNPVTALYNQIVNMKFHGNSVEYPLFYEYGFSYGGILTCGFCQFLHQLVQHEGIDKLLFVARDGDIMEKVYKKYFNDIDTVYLIFSRFASYELIFEDFPEEYIDKNIKPRMARIGTDNSIKKILRECGLEFLEEVLFEEGLSSSDILQQKNFEKLRKLILRHKSDVQENFSQACNAAKEYIVGAMGTSRKVCVVDFGWHGKSIVFLKHLCEKKYGWHGTVVGAMVGASENIVVQNYIRTGLMHIYAFENEYWRSMSTRGGRHMEYKECICLEALFTSASDTLLRYTYDKNGRVDFLYGQKNRNRDIVTQIHKGVLDFSEQFMPLIQKYHLRITERDAYTPIDTAMQNQKYQDKIYQSYYEKPNAINGF